MPLMLASNIQYPLSMVLLYVSLLHHFFPLEQNACDKGKLVFF